MSEKEYVKVKKVLISSRSFGSTSKEPTQILEQAGFECVFLNPTADKETVMEQIKDANALIAGTAKIDRDIILAAEQLEIIARYGAGVDNLDLEAAREQNVRVTNAAGQNADAVADLAWGLIFDTRRGISRAKKSVQSGQYKPVIGRDINEATLGLIGFGAIAQCVARRAVGFSMQVLAYDPYMQAVPEEFASYVRLCSLEEVIASSDIVSIHVPLTEQTENMFDKTSIMQMKKDAVLINLGRGGIIHETDLYECMKDGHLFGAGLDVTKHEPVETDNPLLTLENVTITPHMGMSSAQVIHKMSMICAQNVVNQFTGQELQHVVV